jgi:hypothetical protein
MPESGGEVVEELLQVDVVLLVPLVEAEGLYGDVSTVRPSCSGWRSLAHVEEPVWCTREPIEGSQSFMGSQGNWLRGCRSARMAEAACPR